MAQRPGMIPTILITGFLGAGKTTLLNRLINFYASKRTVVLINEFSKIGIDGDLLVKGEYEKIELNKGSLFCICVRTDLIAAIEKIVTTIRPELLLIEATGLADTSEMENILSLPNLLESIQLHACICLVDAQNFLKIKDNLRAPASQIRSADLVLLNKIDLVNEDQQQLIIQEIKAISPQVTIITCTFADFPMTIINQVHHPPTQQSNTPGEACPDPVFSMSLEKKGRFTQHGWNEFKTLLQSNVLRVKGFVFIENNAYYVDVTDSQWSEQSFPGKQDATNRLVIIGQRLEKFKIERQFNKLLQVV